MAAPTILGLVRFGATARWQTISPHWASLSGISADGSRREVATYLTYVTLLRTSCVYRTSEGALTMNLKDHDCAADFTLL